MTQEEKQRAQQQLDSDKFLCWEEWLYGSKAFFVLFKYNVVYPDMIKWCEKQGFMFLDDLGASYYYGMYFYAAKFTFFSEDSRGAFLLHWTGTYAKKN